MRKGEIDEIDVRSKLQNYSKIIVITTYSALFSMCRVKRTFNRQQQKQRI